MKSYNTLKFEKEQLEVEFESARNMSTEEFCKYYNVDPEDIPMFIKDFEDDLAYYDRELEEAAIREGLYEDTI